MNRFFVYYHDDYPDNGGQGFQGFPTEDKAIEFIHARLKLYAKNNSANANSYTLIEGRELKLKPIEVTTRFEVDRSGRP